MAKLAAKNVYIIFMYGYDPELTFSLKPGEPIHFYYALQEALENAGYRVQFSPEGENLHDVAAILSWNFNQNIFNNIQKHPKEKCFLLIFEPPLIRPDCYETNLKQLFGTIYTQIDDFVDNKNYFRIFNQPSSLTRIENVPDFSEKKFCTMINSNKSSANFGEIYSERRRALAYFSQMGEFDLYGHGWEGFPCWKGILESQESLRPFMHLNGAESLRNIMKLNTLKNYKFCICYENMTHQRGYISEKLPEAFSGGCVPIYYGADNIEDYVPKECFIDFRNFRSYPELYEFLKSMDPKTYESYLDAANRWLHSPQAECFSPVYMAKKIVKRILDVQ